MILSIVRLFECSVRFSPLIDWLVGEWGWGVGDGGDDIRFSRDSLSVFSTGGHCEQFWHGQGCPLFDVDHPAFSLPTMASATLQGALKDGLGEAVVARDMPKPCKFPSLDSCQKRFLGTHTEADLIRKGYSQFGICTSRGLSYDDSVWSTRRLI